MKKATQVAFFNDFKTFLKYCQMCNINTSINSRCTHPMKRSILFAAISSALLTGCDNSHEPQSHKTSAADFSTELRQTNTDVVPGAQGQDTELKDSLAQLQATDPSVKDMYYGTGENGERVVHVVREEQNSEGASSVTSSVWPLLGGMAVGALVANMVSSGGVSKFSSTNPPYRANSFYSRDDERSNRNNNYRSNERSRGNQQSAQQRYNYGSSNQPRYDNGSNRTSSASTPTAQPATAKRTVAPSPSSTVNSAPAKTSSYYSPTRAAVQPTYTPPASTPRSYTQNTPASSYKPAQTVSTRQTNVFKRSPSPSRSTGRSSSR